MNLNHISVAFLGLKYYISFVIVPLFLQLPVKEHHTPLPLWETLM
jgi:hypothetical protein